ncbi:MAG: hypothetical protein A2857_06065 [Candidatus Levybacteria bacterium RIFCSPHIGHO2_01_FULL_36_15]|nr:MAG: hypothetical protein A2857_06065 [Candidatus Levybacteria bacterium RIFCSPHIGHO2_01_FULL_36_15]OGH37551.1 MAG: hypothetical protein A2905_01270 [Candidatus Levybacteria bacterium RIFCSPLOWO2_01_FULL_36_10]
MKNIFKIIHISKPLHRLITLIALLIVFSSLLELVSPILSKYIVDEIVLKVQNKGGNLQRLILLISLAFSANLIGLIGNTTSERLGDHFAGRIRQFLTEKFYHKVLTLPQSYFDSEISGKIVNQLNRGIFSIQQFLNSATNFILPTILQSIFTITVLMFYSLPIAIFTLALFPVYIGLSYYSSIKWGQEEVKKNAIEDASRGRIQEVISNMPLVKSFNNQHNELKIISDNLSNINKIYAVQSRTFHIFEFIRGLGLIIVLLLVNIFVFYDTYIGILSIGEMVLIIQLVNQARRPLFAMSFILTNIQNAESGSKEFIQILEIPSKEYFEERKNPLIKNPKIEFKNVSFKYITSKRVLDDVSLKLSYGEKIALVGHSGAGKTTIINLILKFYEPTKGNIYLNGKSYKKLSHSYIRDNISLVFQENELFSSTIKENVSYGTDADEDQIIQALKLANAYDFVNQLPKGMDSHIGERGVRLSGGQKQRIQIARAILKNAPILILDEATSSLDAKSEKEVQEALNHLMKNKLVVIIAHRFSTIQNVDKIIVIENGAISDSGSPRELAGRPGIYSDLLAYQLEGNKKLLEKFEIY